MRFVTRSLLALSLPFIFAPNGAAKPWETVSLNPESPASAPAPRHVQLSKGGTRNASLAALSSLEATAFATGLGTISALERNEAGHIYAADKQSGRIWALQDRGADGTLDNRRPLPARFDAPTGLAFIGETLYIADRQAIWALDKDAPAPRQVASLNHVQSTGPRPLLASGETLLLAISTANSAKLIEVNTETGFASLRSELSHPIHSLSKRESSDVWAGIDGGFIRVSEGAQPVKLGPATRIESLILPGQYSLPDDWPASLRGHILAAQTGAGAMRLLAIPTEFGQPQGPARIVLDGFLSETARSAWGAPGAMMSDKRGLFFADPHNGTLWRLSPRPKAPVKITIVDTKDIERPKEVAPRPQTSSQTSPQSKSTLLKGSGITGSRLGAASQLGSASQLAVGSTIIAAYNKTKAEEEAAKEKEKAEKEKLALPPDLSLKPHLD